MNKNNNGKLTDEEILEQSRRSGLTYNEAKEFIARTSVGRGTNIYSDTNAQEVKQKNEQSMRNKSN
ncbi:hypothetical protein ACFO3D_05940 [Virgibacillus kekensis]|uniref:Small, acid-soluble spore protein gamma-type n=1 Tax=Virgibacillus kekensis TaxID=202261 RepID=A0ABV9DHB6_9BACI